VLSTTLVFVTNTSYVQLSNFTNIHVVVVNICLCSILFITYCIAIFLLSGCLFYSINMHVFLLLAILVFIMLVYRMLF